MLQGRKIKPLLMNKKLQLSKLLSHKKVVKCPFNFDSSTKSLESNLTRHLKSVSESEFVEERSNSAFARRKTKRKTI